jgi:hypothetical protein
MFDYVLPVAATGKPEREEPSKKPDQTEGDDDKQKLHTQMIGEKPGDDLGYDPKKIPTEEIPDD